MSRVSFPCFRLRRLLCRRSMKASHMATSLTFGSARSACLAAPLPRPPQPTRPTRRVSSPAAKAAGERAVAATADAADVFRKVRREVGEFMIVLVAAGMQVDGVLWPVRGGLSPLFQPKESRVITRSVNHSDLDWPAC